MKKQIISVGIISAIFHYEVNNNIAYIYELWLGGAEAVQFPLIDQWDVDNFSKMLSDKIGITAEVVQ